MRGTRRWFPKHRTTVLDVLFAAKFVPSFPLLKTMDLARLSEVRNGTRRRIGWTALFAKAHAVVSQQMPELRDMYVKRPVRYLYRHPVSVLSVSVHRPVDVTSVEPSVERLFWGQIHDAESMSLMDIQDRFDNFAKAPLKEVYKHGLILEAFPNCLRKFAWCWVMNWAGRKRAKYVGTFSISSLAAHKCLNAFHPLVTTSSLAFGPLSSTGQMDVVLLCDHRVLDGVLAANALNLIEKTLNTTVLEELALC